VIAPSQWVRLIAERRGFERGLRQASVRHNEGLLVSKLSCGYRFAGCCPCFSVALMVWDVHNQRACAWCDTGLPVWPYQAPSLLLRGIDAPAFVVATPFFLLPPMLLAMIVLWWWWLRARIDFGLLACRHYRSPKLQPADEVAASRPSVIVPPHDLPRSFVIPVIFAKPPKPVRPARHPFQPGRNQ
jgi:hypothetical protein